MIRLVALLVLIIAVVWLYRKKKRQVASPPPAQSSNSANSVKSGETEKMLSCAHCGVYLPASEAIQKQGQYFCCEQHAHQA